jgi:phosphocarrier protein
MRHREVEIVNKLGLNAPTSTKLTQLAAKYQCDVSLARSGRKVNAQSLTGVMMLAAGKGSRVVLETNGQDDMQALSAIVALIRDYFGEGDDAKQLSSDHRRPVTAGRRTICWYSDSFTLSVVLASAFW